VASDRAYNRVRPRGATGQRQGERPNIADIAELANVSTSAVSYALNGREGVGEKTRQRILEIAAQLNWRPSSAARALVSEQASAVGVVTIYDPDAPVLSADFASRFLVGVQDELRRHDLLLTLQMVDDFDSANQVYRRWVGERRVDGVFVLNPVVDDPRLEVLPELRLPSVVVGDFRRKHPRVGSVWTDDSRGTDLAVDHLVGLGHRRIGRIGGEPHYQHVAIRRRAFARSLSRRGLTPDPRVQRTTSVTQLADLLRGPDPVTALLVDDTEAAIGAVVGLRELGLRVPEDLSVIVWDDDEKTVLVDPPLTVLRRDVTGYGRRAAQALIESIRTGEPSNALGAEAELVVRRSTAAPAAG
jgi:DNA-binding LacI/PurR family transcriptional regulator